MDDLIQKLMISKKIMEKHDQMGRNSQTMDKSMIGDYDDDNVNSNIQQVDRPAVQSFEIPKSSYNIPQEFLPEASIPQIPKATGTPTKDRIISSKLPDAIKKLMIEHPIQQPELTSTTLSDELIEKASRLMGTSKKQVSNRPQQINESVDKTSLKQMMREVMEELLTENGLIVEETTKMNETIQFKVGKTIFEGRITKVKKLK
jgi:hypothetical protein